MDSNLPCRVVYSKAEGCAVGAENIISVNKAAAFLLRSLSYSLCLQSHIFMTITAGFGGVILAPVAGQKRSSVAGVVTCLKDFPPPVS